MRLGLLGGTFDPIHRGHLVMARAAAGLGLDRVLFVPAHHPPHKEGREVTGSYHRFAMVALGLLGETNLCLSDHEVERAGTSFTIDTVRHFVSRGHEVTLIMGTDSLDEIGTWKECQAILDLAAVIAYPRGSARLEATSDRLPAWARARLVLPSSAGPTHARRPGLPPPILCLDGERDAVSSSEVRSLLRRGRSVTGLVPAGTEEYILKHRLYVESAEGSDD